jgi:hypothetical protein
MRTSDWRSSTAGDSVGSGVDPLVSGDDTLVMDAAADPEGRAGGGAADGLAAELAAAAPRRLWNRSTVLLGALLLLTLGFLAGAQVQQRYGEPAGGSQAANRPGGPGAGGFSGGFAGPAGGAPSGAPSGDAPSTGDGTSSITGTVKLVDGDTIYLETADGTVLTVRTGDQTTVRRTDDLELGELASGDPVTVRGRSGADGTVAATEVTVPDQ